MGWVTYVLKEKITIAGSIFYAGEDSEHGVSVVAMGAMGSDGRGRKLSEATATLSTSS